MSEQLLLELVSDDTAVAQNALAQINEVNDIRFVPALIDLYWMGLVGLNEWSSSAQVIDSLEQLSGEQLGDDWSAWVVWYSQTEIEPPSGYINWKGDLFGKIDPTFADFFIDPVADSFRPGEIVYGGVVVDGIPALNSSEQVPATASHGTFSWEPVFGVSLNGDSRAYPLRIMDWHEMANDVIGGVPVSIAYCTLCGAAIAYEARLEDGTPLDFGSSGLLYRSNKLMYDRQTRSIWNQLTGEPVMGPALNRSERLDLVPITLTTWAEWLEMHPNSTILSEDTGYIRDYISGAAYGDYFVDDGTLFPVTFNDSILDAKDQIYGLVISGMPIAYPVHLLAEAKVLNDTVNSQDIVLVTAESLVQVQAFSHSEGDYTYQAGAQVRAYERADFQFKASDAPDQLLDQNGQLWQVREHELMSEDGVSLKRINGHLSFWFGWSGFYTDTAVYAP
ncbi:MAG: DUF3179 domain-containing protein [Chloroflexota bacterium]